MVNYFSKRTYSLKFDKISKCYFLFPLPSPILYIESICKQTQKLFPIERVWYHLLSFTFIFYVSHICCAYFYHFHLDIKK